MASMLLLVAGALVLMSVVSVTRLDSVLTDRVDEELASRYSGQLQIAFDPKTKQLLSTPSDTIIMWPDVNADGGLYYLYLHSGELPSSLPFSGVAAEDIQVQLESHLGGEAYTIASADGKTRWRFVTRVATVNSSGEQHIVGVGVDLKDVTATVAELTTIDLLVGTAVLIALASIGVAMIRASLNPLRQMEATAVAIAAGDLSRRVPQHDVRTEVGQLGAALNTMLGQIETAFAAATASEAQALRSEEKMRRFIADASHELRTPLTTVRGFAELYRQRGDSAGPEEVAASMRRIEDEAKRMGLLVEDLLLLARLDRERPVQADPVDLLSLAADGVTGAKVTHPERPLDLKVGRGPLIVLGDELRLRQILSNLLANALAHTPPETPIEVRVYAEGVHAYLEVADEGPGMTPDQAERVFERFYRVDPARGRQSGGSGLGLAIVSALVAAHNGRVTVHTEVGVGTVFRVRLDLDPDLLAPEPEEPAEEALEVSADVPADAPVAPLSANSQDESRDA
ncbi:sensor histidine kinase [Actinorhabdospora filicis]